MAYFWYSWLGVGVAVVFCHVYFAWWGRDKRPRVDWEHVYAMERAIWGQTFAHAGAPSAVEASGYNPFSNPSLPLANYGIASPGELHRAVAYLTRNEQREGYFARNERLNLEWEADKENAYMSNDYVEEVFRRGY